jgi:hypothetical protein
MWHMGFHLGLLAAMVVGWAVATFPLAGLLNVTSAAGVGWLAVAGLLLGGSVFLVAAVFRLVAAGHAD